MDNGTLTPLLKKMQSQGYIEKHRSEEGDWAVLITLAEKGRQLQVQVKDVLLQVAGCIALRKKRRIRLTAFYMSCCVTRKRISNKTI